MLYSVYAVLGVCCTRCTLSSVYAVLGVSCTRCMPYTLLRHDQRHGEMERDDLTLCSAIIVELWTRKRDRGWRCELYGGYERIWGIRGKTCLNGFGRPRIGVITHRIGIRTCPPVDSTSSHTRNSLSPSFSWWFPPSPLISLILIFNSTLTSEHKVKSSLAISACHDH